MDIIGIDPGRANTGIAMYNTQSKSIVMAETIELPIPMMRKMFRYSPAVARLSILSSQIREILNNSITSVPIAFIEDYAYGATGTTKEDLLTMDRDVLGVAESYGAIMSVIGSKNIPTVFVPPSQLKLFISGDGRCEKTEIIKIMSSTYDLTNVNANTDHAYDAIALCHLGRYFVAFCRKPGILEEGKYETSVITQLAYSNRFRDVTSYLEEIFKSVASKE
jgi:Holliday junction resolvasome RuvABC endonuclease subunit